MPPLLCVPRTTAEWLSLVSCTARARPSVNGVRGDMCCSATKAARLERQDKTIWPSGFDRPTAGFEGCDWAPLNSVARTGLRGEASRGLGSKASLKQEALLVEQSRLAYRKKRFVDEERKRDRGRSGRGAFCSNATTCKMLVLRQPAVGRFWRCMCSKRLHSI